MDRTPAVSLVNSFRHSRPQPARSDRNQAPVNNGRFRRACTAAISAGFAAAAGCQREQTTRKSIAGAADQSIIGEIEQWLSI
jgi:hypothetical protein